MKKKQSYLEGEDLSPIDLRDAEEHLEKATSQEASSVQDELFNEIRTGHEASSFLLQSRDELRNYVVGNPVVHNTSPGFVKYGVVSLLSLVILGVAFFWPETEVTTPSTSSENKPTSLVSDQPNEHADFEPSETVYPSVVENTDPPQESENTDVIQEPEGSTSNVSEMDEDTAPISENTSSVENSGVTVQTVVAAVEGETTQPDQRRQRTAIQIVNPAATSEEQVLQQSIEATSSSEERMDLHLQLARVYVDKQDFGSAAREFHESLLISRRLQAHEFSASIISECQVVWERAPRNPASIALARAALGVDNLQAELLNKAREVIENSKK